MNQKFFSTVNKKKKYINDKLVQINNNKSKCHDINYNSCYRCCCIVGPTGPAGPSGEALIMPIFMF